MIKYLFISKTRKYVTLETGSSKQPFVNIYYFIWNPIPKHLQQVLTEQFMHNGYLVKLWKVFHWCYGGYCIDELTIKTQKRHIICHRHTKSTVIHHTCKGACRSVFSSVENKTTCIWIIRVNITKVKLQLHYKHRKNIFEKKYRRGVNYSFTL